MQRIGFIGLGVMGTPMARNLARHFPLTVWNRSAGKYAALEEVGASIAESPAAVIAASDATFVSLFNDEAVTTVFRARAVEDALRNANNSREEKKKKKKKKNQSLARQVAAAGALYVEMPVSGSKIPAEQGQLVALLAGDDRSVIEERVRPLLGSITREAVYCGPVGTGLKAKYAINTFLITVTAGLAESINLATAQGLEPTAFAQVLRACPMASAYSDIKIDKVLRGDWAPQASLEDCFNSTQLIERAAEAAGSPVPLMQACSRLYRRALDAGLGEEDMISVLKVNKNEG